MKSGGFAKKTAPAELHGRFGFAPSPTTLNVHACQIGKTPLQPGIDSVIRGRTTVKP